METMYSGKINSPATTLDGGINSVVTTINVVDGSVLPAAPNLAVIGTGEDAETILYATKVGNALSNITRAFQGVAIAWLTGESIARLFTAYDYESLKSNSSEMAARKITDFAAVSSAELLAKITDETGTGKAVFGTLPTINKINLSEGQIAFPAVVNPSAGVNTLDDYEEGEWTPALEFGGASVDMTYSIQAGLYTKIGRQVTVTCHIYLSAKGSSTGVVLITGLPFACKDDEGANSAPILSFYNISFADVFEGRVTIDSTHIKLFEITNAGARTYLTYTDFTDTSSIRMTLTYFVD